MNLECQMPNDSEYQNVKLAGRPSEREVFLNKFAVYGPGISLKKDFEFIFMQISRKYSEQLVFF